MGDVHAVAERERRQILARAALGKSRPSGLRGCFGRASAVEQRRRFGREHDLGIVDFRPAEALEPGDFVQRQVREQPQELAHVHILRVPPELPIIVWAKQLPA